VALLSISLLLGVGVLKFMGRGVWRGLYNEEIEFSLNTLECPGVPGDEELLSWRCLAGGTPNWGSMRCSASGGEGVDLDCELLLCIEDIEEEGVIYKELRARVRFPSIF
jgi:hypothetical protein